MRHEMEPQGYKNNNELLVHKINSSGSSSDAEQGGRLLPSVGKDEEGHPSTMFTVPLVRSGTAAINRALFTRVVPLAAAAVASSHHISKYRHSLNQSRKLLKLKRISPVVPHPDPSLAVEGRKCLLLHPDVKLEAPDTWGSELQRGIEEKCLSLIPYELRLDYDYWTAHDILLSILPEGFQDDIPSAFTTVGHVAHVNLREHFLPYKRLIGQVILEKSHAIETVIMKTQNVGQESEFRTFNYEVLAGEGAMDVRVSQGGCVFDFNYAQVYWNTRLEPEHGRIVKLFQPGEVVCDVMAGIGPFAVPAGKKCVFVWANDLNPASYEFLTKAINKNKVSKFVQPFCGDGRAFIPYAADQVLDASQARHYVDVPCKPSKNIPKPGKTPPREIKRWYVPATVSHFVMNLPASAIDFLDAFRGIYHGKEHLFEQSKKMPGKKLPLVHVYCFALRDDVVPDATVSAAIETEICERISRALGLGPGSSSSSSSSSSSGRKLAMRPGKNPDADEGVVSIHDVRDVAPAKRMMCATFRLPWEVVFAPRPGGMPRRPD